MRRSVVKKRLYGFLSYCRPFVPKEYHDGMIGNIEAGEFYLTLDFMLSWVDDFDIPLGSNEAIEIKELTKELNMEIPNWIKI